MGKGLSTDLYEERDCCTYDLERELLMKSEEDVVVGNSCTWLSCMFSTPYFNYSPFCHGEYEHVYNKANWMQELAEHIGHRPIYRVALPGDDTATVLCSPYLCTYVSPTRLNR